MSFLDPQQTPEEIARYALARLREVVSIDSASDERSPDIPSTPGQTRLVEALSEFFAARGAQVERDDFGTMVATLAGRGAGAGAAPLALLIHVDTARGTQATEALSVTPSWDGSPLRWRANERLEVSVQNYPSLSRYLGHDVVHGPGDAPFGLDDKLGLCHMMTLAWLLETNPAVDHPPLLLIGRPDEEIGRMEALEGVAALLAARGVSRGYTLDGLDPLEINVANFNAAQASVWFPARPVEGWVGHSALRVHIGGVNTHGATAKAEGHRPATRLAAELLALLQARGFGDSVHLSGFASDPLRDCDATFTAHIDGEGAGRALRDALQEVVGPHLKRGASWDTSPAPQAPCPDLATHEMLGFVSMFLQSNPGFTLSAEASEGWDGYSQPYRALPDGEGLRLDLRLRDFDAARLRERQAHALSLAGERRKKTWEAYVNMAPALEDAPELVTLAQEAARALGQEAPVLPIRGGTGVDPFLERGVKIANLGTGYFSPESEKELTSVQMMAAHARWLFALVQEVGA